MARSNSMIDLQKEYFKALELHDRGCIEDAERAYRSILKREPFHFGATYSLAAVFLSRGDYEAAETHLARAISIEPRNPLAQINRGVALKSLGRLALHGCSNRAAPEFRAGSL